MKAEEERKERVKGKEKVNQAVIRILRPPDFCDTL
jgi:hypothetical protein